MKNLNKTAVKVLNVKGNVKKVISRFVKENNGDVSALGVIVMAFIVVIVGAALLTIFKSSVTTLWTNITTMITSNFKM